MPSNSFTFPSWSLIGNAGTTAGTNFHGTTDNIDVVFKRNNLAAGRIGTTNTSYGNEALAGVTTGTNHTAYGNGAAKAVTTATNNIAIGYLALNKATSGSDNLAIGNQALENNLTGTANTAIGRVSLQGTTGQNNIAVGWGAGNGITSGNKNLVVAFNGVVPTATGSNQLNIGNVLWGTGCSGTSTTPAGSLSIGATAPNISAIFDLTSTTQGLGIPLLNTVQVNGIATPKIGLIVYNTDLDCPVFYSSIGWRKISHSAM